MADKLCEVVHWDGFNRKFTHPVPASQAEAKAREWIRSGAVAAEVRDPADDSLILRLERGGSGAAVQTFPTRSSSSNKPGDSAHGSKARHKLKRP